MAPQEDSLKRSDSANDPLAPQVQQALGDEYVVGHALGQGSTARVYLADQQSLGRKVAVKVLLPRRARDRKTVVRFKREARAMAGCPHPGIISVHNVGETGNGLPFFVMEYVEGETLADRLQRKQKLPLQEVVRIITPLADALTYAHERGLVHRDVKPADIHIEERTGRVLLTDFGLAKSVVSEEGVATVTGTGEILGTPPYLSPEQAESGRVGARSDQYSLAVVTYEMLAGRRPFSGPTPQDYIRQHAQDTPVSLQELEPALPVEVARAVDRALMKEPGARFSSAEAFGQALRGAASSPNMPVQQPDSRTSRKPARRLLQAAIIYAGAAWGSLEATTWVLETFGMPMEFRQPALWVVIAGFPVMLVLVWYFSRAPRDKRPTADSV